MSMLQAALCFVIEFQLLARMFDYQSVAPDGPSMPPPIKKETWVAGKQEGGAGRQSAVPAARLGTVVG
jgi:hypothetical protein